MVEKRVAHPWHDIEIGNKAPKVVNIVVETPKDSKVKYELDKSTGLLRMDRYLYSAVHYPGDYGFIPRTLWDDQDPLDVIVFSNVPAYPMTICEVKVIGIVRLVDAKEKDDKIIAVHANDPRYSEWDSIKDVPQHFLRELRHFLETYKELQGKRVRVYRILGPEQAYKAIERAIRLYKAKFGAK
ncbi:inorganic diphosphatase [Candidatus Woesearchaeota archaeon]|nr:inorganic diphosphatase [Candidatus Woesearchaeota archaeon]RLE42312.1 MAG: inorganic diphosphatase [Candidatus Woesearchaeota archaeon]